MKNNNAIQLLRFSTACALLLAIATGCARKDNATTSPAPKATSSAETESASPSSPAAPTPTPREPERNAALLLSQAQFVKKTGPDGKSQYVPGPAKLVVLYADRGRWTPEVIEDPDANVFHKAMPVDLPGEQPGILTIGANAAPDPGTLKLWHRTADGWKGTLLWGAKFGGKFNRFRDVEVGDVTGDGLPEIVVVTHDQGVVAVLSRQDQNWAAKEIDHKKNTFVHEVEIGDVDGDGLNEIFATPSAPNTVDGSPQPGWVVMYKHTDDGFTRRVIAESDQRHYKEILVADVDDDGRPELYTVLEGVLQTAPGGPDGDVEIRRYRFDDQGRPTDKLVVTLPDKQCRFLHAGDIDGDGNKELVASAFKSGLWIIRPAEEGEWATECIDPDTSGYEHASVLADMDGDGTPEIYVADDQGKASGGQGKLRVYAWDGAAFEHANLFDLTPGDITFGLMAVLDGKYLGAD